MREGEIGSIETIEPVPGAIDILVEAVVDRPLDGLTAGCRNLETATQQRRPLATIGTFGLLDAEIEALQTLADLDGDQRSERDIDHDCSKGQNGAAITAEEIQSLHVGGHFDQLLADEESRQEHTDNAHDEADGPARHALDRFLQTLIDIVGLILAPALLQMEMCMLAVQKRSGELVIQPFAPFTVQRRGQEMAGTDQHHILCQHQQNKNARIGGNGHERMLNGRSVDVNNGIHEQARGFGHPYGGLAHKGRHQEDCDGENPGFLPAVGNPIGAHQPPERRHVSHGRPPPCLQGLLSGLPVFDQSTPRFDN